MNIMKFAHSVEISLHSLMNSLMRLNESNEFINELNEWLMKFIKMTFCPKKYFIASPVFFINTGDRGLKHASEKANKIHCKQYGYK